MYVYAFARFITLEIKDVIIKEIK